MGMMHQLIVGTVRNSRNPVNLLAMECGRQSCLMRVSAIIWLTTLMMTIIPAQIHSHEGIDIVGSNWMAQQATNDKSAMLSRIDPVLLYAWSFLANQPSIMSLMPQKTYSVQNCHPGTLQNRRPIEPTILSAVMMFGRHARPYTLILKTSQVRKLISGLLLSCILIAFLPYKSRLVYLFRFTIIPRTKYAIMATTTGTTTKYTIDISENESFDIWNEELYTAPQTRKLAI